MESPWDQHLGQKFMDPTIVEGDCSLEQEVCITTGHALVQMYVTDSAKAQKEDQMLSAVLHWLKTQKKTDFKGTSGGTRFQQRRKTTPA